MSSTRRSIYLFRANNTSTQTFSRFLRDIGIPGNDVVSIDDALQARFFQKKPGTNEPLERWELKKVEMQCHPDIIRDYLALCGFIYETGPGQPAYTRAAWPGAKVIRAAARLFDLMNTWEKGFRWNETIVFGGKRQLQEDEGFEQCCAAIGRTKATHDLSTYERLWRNMSPQTELDMMRFLWSAFALPEQGWKAVFVDAPMKPPVKEGGPPVRPNTEDTIVEWLKSNPKPGSMLLSSGAPYGMAQDEAFWMLLEPHGHTVDTFGHAAPESLGIEALMREVAGAVNRIRRARHL